MIRIHYRHSTKQRTDTGAFKPGRRDHPNNELQAREFPPALDAPLLAASMMLGPPPEMI